MKVLERLPVMSDAELLSLAENAQANLAKPSRSADAATVLEALREEQGRRAAVRAEAGAQALAAVRERMAELGLQARTAAAFRERSPVVWEARAIHALADNEGLTTEGLSKVLGFSGGYMNMAFGTLCHDRQAWLGAPPRAKRADGVIYSALLVDFTERADEATGARWTEWRLKPEARAGLAAAGVIAAAAKPTGA